MILFQKTEAKFALCKILLLLLSVIYRLVKPNIIWLDFQRQSWVTVGSSVLKTLHKHELINSLKRVENSSSAFVN